MTICFSLFVHLCVCVCFAGLCKYYWLALHEKKQKLGHVCYVLRLQICYQTQIHQVLSLGKCELAVSGILTHHCR